MQQEKNLVLVSREDYEQTEAAEKQKKEELKQLEKCVWENLENNGELDSVVSYLNSFKTTAAAYRRLADLYISRDIDDFRKKFPKQNCTRERVKQHICLRELEKLLAHMQAPSKTLDQYFKDASILQNLAVPIPRPIGEPIVHLNR